MAAPRPSATDPTRGDPASEAALKRLRGQLAAAAPGRSRGLDEALAAIARADFAAAEVAAQAATEACPDDGFAWYLLAIAREKLGRVLAALEAYEQALARLPDHADLASDLGRLALRLAMPELAAPLFQLHLARRPDSLEAKVSLAAALRDQHRYADAIEILRPVLRATPGDPRLWNALGVVVSQQGDPAKARTFFLEALRLDPDFAQARYHLAGARLDLGDPEGALAEVETALAQPVAAEDGAMMRYARALMLLCAGRVGEGWEAYAARLSPDFAAAPDFAIDLPAWRPEEPLAGRSLLVVGEQGLGDEVMFAGVIPDVLVALGDAGRLTLAVEPRLVALFARSFPTATVVPHTTDKSRARAVRGVEAVPRAPDGTGSWERWTPMGSLLPAFRPDLAAFPDRPHYLVPDPARVARWRAWLQTLPPGRKVGLLWKSLKLGGERRRGFAPFAAWAPVLAALSGVTFVNLQYGDCAAEIAEAQARLGVTIWSPPGLDLKDDLDDVAALAAALDLVVGFANAASNLAGAVGAPLWLILGPDAWPALGSGRYPWYPQARVFQAKGFGDWSAVMAEVAGALGEPPGA
jgi:tetratricopeptide (TPR) repeat protein